MQRSGGGNVHCVFRTSQEGEGVRGYNPRSERNEDSLDVNTGQFRPVGIWVFLIGCLEFFFKLKKPKQCEVKNRWV